MILLGVDEAGLGPTLGPLVTAGAAFRAPGGVDPDDYGEAFFAAYAPALTPDPRAARRDPSRLAVGDSKRVHGVGGAALLERTVGAFLNCVGGCKIDPPERWLGGVGAQPAPTSTRGSARSATETTSSAPEAEGRREERRSQLRITDRGDAVRPGGADLPTPEAARDAALRALGDDDAADRLARLPWHDAADAAWLDPPDGDSANAARAAFRDAVGRAARAGWGFQGFRARVSMPGRLNEAFASGLNKHEASMRETGRALAWADAAFPDEPVAATVDLQGGRRKYAPFLSSLFADAWVRTESETAAGSIYTVERAGRPPRRIAFRAKADASSPATALASMLAKAWRERFMAEWNAWFAARIPGLAPTAGYPGDAPRFLADAAAVLAELEAAGLPRDEMVRQR